MNRACRQCKQSFPVEAFKPFKNSPDGLSYFCDDCTKIRAVKSLEKSARKQARKKAEAEKVEAARKAKNKLLNQLRKGEIEQMDCYRCVNGKFDTTPHWWTRDKRMERCFLCDGKGYIVKSDLSMEWDASDEEKVRRMLLGADEW